MAVQSTALSKHEKRGRASASADAASPDRAASRLLYSRKQTQQLLGDVSIATLIRLERAGILRPKRLLNSPTGQVFYTHENVVEVARGAADAR
jgi:hypothetical protein